MTWCAQKPSAWCHVSTNQSAFKPHVCTGCCNTAQTCMSSLLRYAVAVPDNALQAALNGKSPKKGRPVVAYAVALAAALSVESPFMHVDNIMVHRLPCWSACLLSYSSAACCCVVAVSLPRAKVPIMSSALCVCVHWWQRAGSARRHLHKYMRGLVMHCQNA